MPKKPYAASVSGILEGCWKTLENLKKISARLCKCNKKHAQNLSFPTCFLLKLAERKGFVLACGLGQGAFWHPTGVSFISHPFESFQMPTQKGHLSVSCVGGEEGIRTLVGLPPNGFQEVAHPSRLIPDNLQNAPKFTSFSHFIGHLPENCEKNAR